MTKLVEKNQIPWINFDEHSFYNRQPRCSSGCGKCNGTSPELDGEDFCHTCNTQL